VAGLGRPDEIGRTFSNFQQYLYNDVFESRQGA